MLRQAFNPRHVKGVTTLYPLTSLPRYCHHDAKDLIFQFGRRAAQPNPNAQPPLLKPSTTSTSTPLKQQIYQTPEEKKTNMMLQDIAKLKYKMESVEKQMSIFEDELLDVQEFITGTDDWHYEEHRPME